MTVAVAVRALVDEIRALKAERGAAILAHNYQRPEIQDVADLVADSLKMARRATELDAPVLVICGVHFMAETAAIANPDKRVLIPDLRAGCSLAATVQAADVRAWRAAHPDGMVVAYVNTAAAVKAETDYCCTSGNAVAVINAIPPGVPLLFLPDFFLGNYLKRVTGRSMDVWMGECHVHAGLTRDTLEERQVSRRLNQWLAGRPPQRRGSRVVRSRQRKPSRERGRWIEWRPRQQWRLASRGVHRGRHGRSTLRGRLLAG
jgi:quinolinate synthase